jgi:hypothetical protein
MGKLHAIKEVLNAQVKHSSLHDKDFSNGVAEKPFVCKAFSMNSLDDGIYEVIIIDAEDDDERDVARLHLTVTTGQHKGDVVTVRAEHLGVDALSLLALPARLIVRDGVPSVELQ